MSVVFLATIGNSIDSQCQLPWVPWKNKDTNRFSGSLELSRKTKWAFYVLFEFRMCSGRWNNEYKLAK